MKRKPGFFIVVALAAGLAGQAQALGGLADVTITDRDTGAALAAHYYKGEYWVAGAPGHRYAVSINSRSGERLLAVTAVDGVNIISGQTAGWDQTGYVFAPWQGYELTGWRKSDREIAAFEFTAAPNSYASRTDRPRNVGVIGVALFRERVPERIALREEVARAADANATGAASSPAPAAEQKAMESDALASRGRVAANQAPKLGTGHGQRETSYVERTDFERAQHTPNEVIRIRYDSFDNLVAMGVIRRSQPVPSRLEAFPDTPFARYVPDPR
jgi:hypothetical protein